MSERIAVCPGSFDPITLGHLDIIRRAAAMFDKLIVVVMTNPAKKCAFTSEERRELIKKSVADIPNVEVDCYDGLLAEYAGIKKATAIVSMNFRWHLPIKSLIPMLRRYF